MNVFSDIENVCAICKTAQDAGQHLIDNSLLINFIDDGRCGHKFCRDCSKRKLQLEGKRQFACPLCGSAVKQSTLSASSIDEIEVTNDARVRRRVKEIYNASESDFLTWNEFCDYEEMVEDIIYNLVHGIDRQAIEQQIKEYERSHMESILSNRRRRAELAENEGALLREESWQTANRAQAFQLEDEDELRRTKELKRQRNEIMLGERDRLSCSSSQGATSRLWSDAPGQMEAPHVAPQHTPASAPAPAGSSAPNPVLAFLMQRPEPRPHIQIPPSEKPPKDAVYKAGGFDPTVCLHRNWFEMIHGLLSYKTVLLNADLSTSSSVEATVANTGNNRRSLQWCMTWDE